VRIVVNSGVEGKKKIIIIIILDVPSLPPKWMIEGRM